MQTETLRRPPPALFALLVVPFGAAVGFQQIAAPYLLQRQGVSLAAIGAFYAITGQPHAWKFLWAPLIDLSPRRKSWFVGSVALTAASLFAASLIVDPGHLWLLGVLTTAAQLGAATSSAAINVFMATQSTEQSRGRVSGFYMAGNCAATSIIGALPILLHGRAPAWVSGAVLALAVAVGGAGIWFIDEARQAAVVAGSAVQALVRRLREVGRDLWGMVTSRRGITGMVICLAPVGCGALTNLFSAMGDDFHASAEQVFWVTGTLAGLAGALGSLAGGLVLDRMRARIAYGLMGGLTAATALAMVKAPWTPTTYLWGVCAYSFMNGAAFAAFYALALDLVSGGAAVATKYSLLVAISNQAISLTTFGDGKAAELHLRGRALGTAGSFWGDAALTALGILVLLAMLWVDRARPERRSAPAEQLRAA